MAGRPQNKGIDMLLLRKIFQQGQMTVVEISEMFETLHGSHISGAKIAKLRRQMGVESPKTMICPYCGLPKALNCFRSGYTGCIKCRIERGEEESHWHGNKGKQKKNVHAQIVRAVCLKCNNKFSTRLDIFGKKLNRICPTCSKTNAYLGDQEETFNLMFG